MLRRLGLLTLGLLALPLQAHAEGLERNDPTFKAIEQADARLFTASYGCDIATFSSLIDDDFEFYHDRTGLAVSKQALVDATRNNICHKVRRTLVTHSLRVFPVANYGAIEAGRHRFCNVVETPMCKASTDGTAGSSCSGANDLTATSWLASSATIM